MSGLHAPGGSSVRDVSTMTPQADQGQAGRGRTRTSVAPVEGEAREVELARMLSGSPDSGTAREHARELLDAAGGDRRR